MQYVVPSLVSLNLSSTKLGLKGCIELARHFNIFSEENGVQYSALKYLDLSNNHIGTEGFTKLVAKLRYSTQLLNLNVSQNEMIENPEKFDSVEKFLSMNKSCQTLNLHGCGLSKLHLFHIGDGLSKNTALLKLCLGDNNLSDPLCLKYITDGLLSSKVNP